jgi:hypothetical protein
LDDDQESFEEIDVDAQNEEQSEPNSIREGKSFGEEDIQDSVLPEYKDEDSINNASSK